MTEGNFSIKEIKPQIFLFDFENRYDLSMHFLRYQEFYESPSEDFRRKSFNLIDFMEWYAFEYGKGVFTYPNDWAGFNLPGNIISQVWDLGIPDINKYDVQMLKAALSCQKQNNKFCIIGACSSDEDYDRILPHEVAHGWFYLDQEYKNAMTSLVSSLEETFRKSMEKTLKKLGYTSEVYVDECQAYLSTGMENFFDVSITKEDKPFIDLYKKYSER